MYTCIYIYIYICIYTYVDIIQMQLPSEGKTTHSGLEHVCVDSPCPNQPKQGLGFRV